MTQIALKLHKDHALIFTDQLGASIGGKVVKQYKPHIIQGKGLILVGRGMNRTFEFIEEGVTNAPASCFDEILPLFPGIVKSSIHRFAHEITGGHVSDYNSDELEVLIKDFRQRGWEGFAALSLDIFCIGYSHTKKSMGICLVRSYENYRLEEAYNDGFFWFLEAEAGARKSLQRYGRKPETPLEMATIMRDVYAVNAGEFPGGSKWSWLAGGGDIEMTRLNSDGTYTIENLGPLKRDNVVNLKQAVKSTGRNSPCSCGSGKKYKKCCLLKAPVRGPGLSVLH